MRNRTTSPQIPTHRVIIHRRTGQEVGPRVPISPNDLPNRVLEPAEILWRYMDFWKFEDLLTKSALYFARQDRFNDQFEGRFTAGNAGEFSESDKVFYEAYRIQRSFAEAKHQHDLHRQCVFISCWHRNTKESWQMWRTIESGKESVVVTSSAKALYRFIPVEILKSPVMYHGAKFQRTDFGWNTLAFYKLSAYGFEREFRLLRTLGDGESVSMNDPADYGRLVEVPLKKIIHRVITHPAADEALKNRVDDLLHRHLKGGIAH